MTFDDIKSLMAAVDKTYRHVQTGYKSRADVAAEKKREANPQVPKFKKAVSK